MATYQRLKQLWLVTLIGITGCSFHIRDLNGSSPSEDDGSVISGKSHYLVFGSNMYDFTEDNPEYSKTENIVVPLQGVQSFSTSQYSDYRCAVISNGDAYCWGNNDEGQLGNGTTTASLMPVKVDSTVNFTQITTGSSHTCALDDQGDVYCWGRGSNYALGTGTNVSVTSPVKALLPDPAKFVEAGPYATCAIATNDKVYCWGQNFGTSPTQIATAEVFTSLHGPVQNMMCGLKSGGELFCWGDNNFGKLGVGDTTNRAAPTAVLGGLLFSTLTATGAPNGLCGLTLDKKIYCWGESVMGNSQQSSPLLVNDSLGLTQIGAGGYLEVCGFNSSHQKSCVKVDDGTVVPGETVYGFTNYRGGCGLTADHLLLCSGRVNISGTGLAYLTPGAAAYSFLNDEEFENVVAGESHFCAQKKNDKRLYCWGGNGSGELGLGDMTNRERPVMAVNSPEFKEVFLGYDFTCGIDLNDEVHCTGGNWAGQLGNATTSTSLTFAPVSGGLKFSTLSLSASHSCGLTLLGEAYCWGENNYGQLGDGTMTDRLSPTKVSGGHLFKKIYTSSYSSCGLKTDGSAYCWGSNTSSELGDGTTTNSSAPVKVDTAVKFKELVGGGYYFCGLDSDGKAYCWGNGGDGALGDGTTADRSTPTAVQTSLRFSQLSAFNMWYSSTCAIEKENHKVYCWGYSLNRNIYPTSSTPVLLDIPSASHISVTASGLLFKTSGESVIKTFSVDKLIYTGASVVTLNLEIENSYKDYCILENSTDQNDCVWKTGSIGTSYSPQSTGFIQLTIFLRDSIGRTTQGSSPLFFRN